LIWIKVLLTRQNVRGARLTLHKQVKTNNGGFSGILKGELQANRERHFGAHFPIRFSRTNSVKCYVNEGFTPHRHYAAPLHISCLISHQVANFAMFAAILRASSLLSNFAADCRPGSSSRNKHIRELLPRRGL
jgi:hypothetical protein